MKKDTTRIEHETIQTNARNLTPQEKLALIPKIPPDHPIFKAGFIIGITQPSTSPINTDSEPTALPDRNDLSKLLADLEALGSKKLPPEQGVKIRIYPEPKR
jgi:hypothetical protein